MVRRGEYGGTFPECAEPAGGIRVGRPSRAGQNGSRMGCLVPVRDGAVRESQVKLALQVLSGDFQVAECHVGRLVAEHSHHRRKTHARTEHLRAEGVSKLVWDDV